MRQSKKSRRAQNRASMSPSYLLALTLHEELRLSFDQVAVIMMIPAQTVKQLVRHAKSLQAQRLSLKTARSTTKLT